MPEGVTSHRVQRNETFSGIAKRFQVSVDSLLEVNPQFDPGSRGGGYTAAEARRQARLSDGRDIDYIRRSEIINIPLKPPGAKPAAQTTTAARVNVAPERSAAPGEAAARSVNQDQPVHKPATRARIVAEAAPRLPMPALTPLPSPVALPDATLSHAAPVSPTGSPWEGGFTRPLPLSLPEAPANPPAPIAAEKAPDAPKPPAPPTDPNDAIGKYTPKDPFRQLAFIGSGSGSSDPRSADLRGTVQFDSRDNGASPNSGSFQTAFSATKPGRAQEAPTLLDAQARITIASAARRPQEVVGPSGARQSVETLGWRWGWNRKPEDALASVSVVANMSGVPVGRIAQENGRAVQGKSATSPFHLGLGGSLGNNLVGVSGFYAFGIGHGKVRDAMPSGQAPAKYSSTHTNIYGVDAAYSIKAGTTWQFDKVVVGLNGTRTTTTPIAAPSEPSAPGKVAYFNRAFTEFYIKAPPLRMPLFLPMRSQSTTFDSRATIRFKMDTPTNGSFDPRFTVRADQALFRIDRTVPRADGGFDFKSQFRVDLSTAVQFGRMSDGKPGVQNFIMRLNFNF